MALHRDRLRAVRGDHLAGAGVHRRLCRMGQSDRPPLSRIEPDGLGGGDRALERQCRAITRGRSGRADRSSPACPGGHDASSDDDALAGLRADIGTARGRALLLETTTSGYGEGRTNAPARDWDPRYLHPSPTEGMVKLGDSAFGRVLAACGCSPALFDDSDGTSKREAQRQFFLGTVQPLARVLETELTEKFGVPVRLRFDLYNVDLAGRAAAFQ